MVDKKLDMENLDAQFETHVGVGENREYQTFELGEEIFDENLEESGVWVHQDEEKYGPKGPQFRVARVTSERFSTAQRKINEFLTDHFGVNYKDEEIPKAVRRYMSIRRAMSCLTDWRNVRLPDDTENRPFNEENVKAVLTHRDERILLKVLQTMTTDEKYRIKQEGEFAKN